MLRITPLMHLLQVFHCFLHPWLAFRAAWEQKKRCSFGRATPSSNDSDNKSLCLPFGALSVSSPAPISTVELLFADLREGRWHLTGWLCHRPTRFVQQAANVTASHFQVLLSCRRQIYPRLFHTRPTVSGCFRQVTAPNSSSLVQVWCIGGRGTSNQPEEESWDSFDFKEVKLPDFKNRKVRKEVENEETAALLRKTSLGAFAYYFFGCLIDSFVKACKSTFLKKQNKSIHSFIHSKKISVVTEQRIL